MVITTAKTLNGKVARMVAGVYRKCFLNSGWNQKQSLRNLAAVIGLSISEKYIAAGSV